VSGTPTWVALAYLVAAVCFILALKGLSSPGSARRGNLIGAIGAALATVALFLSGVELDRVGIIIAAVVVGSAVGALVARRARMTQMPQVVALLNGAGGAAAGLVAITEWLHTADMSGVRLVATALTVLIGWVSSTGSIASFLRLRVLTTRPVVIPAGRYVTLGMALAALAAATWMITAPSPAALVVLTVASAVLGVLLVLPIGGADVTIVICLLNAFTGLAVAASGFVLDNVLLIIAGTLVGATGTLLTRMMGRAMGRPLTRTLLGAFTTAAITAGPGGTADRPVRACSPDDVAIMLSHARTVILVPGYGLAVAQAQHALRELADVLGERGVEVMYAIHPVAGRMPGHMNVLLAEANVPYEQLKEVGEVNAEVGSADVALVVGANDVVNPAARDDRSAPLYGMPILDVDRAAQVVVLTRSVRPGFAGIDNELLFAPQTQLLFGDARDSLVKVVRAMAHV
jgi:H+-translocating NAD(P) transhydrogenase subunit beta